MTEVSEKDLISLKDAAKLSGYSADYIGQLIRSGKIAGKQVYCNVQWMTTAQAVMGYKNKGVGQQQQNKFFSGFRKIGMELNILKLFFKTFKSALPILIFITTCFILLVLFLLSSIFADKQAFDQNQIQKEVTF